MKNNTIPGCGFHHVAIRTAKWDESIRFYTQGLGFNQKITWDEAPRRAVMLDTGDGNYLEIFEREAIENGPDDNRASILHFALRADDCEAAVEKARAAGAEVTLEPKVPEPFTQLGLKTKIAFIKGPDGEIVEFFESENL
ncbi:MAG TPA: VOC family protein [Abditibacteriaceae bacterium]|jgi:glyoxylase I family protein